MKQNGGFKELIRQSQDARKSKTCGLENNSSSGFGRRRRRSSVGSVQSILGTSFGKAPSRPLLIERGEQYAYEREFAEFRNREKRYQQQREVSRSLVSIFNDWEALEREFLQVRKRNHFHSRRQLKDEWNQWLKVTNPKLYREVVELHKRRMDLYSWFCLVDADGSGEISTVELEDPLITVGVCKSREEVEALVASVDSDGSGEIGFEEFLSIICADSMKNGKKKGPKSAATKAPGSSNGENPIVKLFQIAANGKLGDESLHFSTKLSNFRRTVIMRALAPEPDEISSIQRTQDQEIVNALQKLYYKKSM